MVDFKIGDYVYLPFTKKVIQLLTDAEVAVCGIIQVRHATPEEINEFKKLKGSAF